MFTCLDHDDGSDYYLDTRNVCVFAGALRSATNVLIQSLHPY